MKYTQQERLDIGQLVYDGELTRYEAALKFDLDLTTVRDYMRLYRDFNHLPPKGTVNKTEYSEVLAEHKKYANMTKAELIRLIVSMENSKKSN